MLEKKLTYHRQTANLSTYHRHAAQPYQVREQPKFRFYASVEVGLKVRVLVFQNVFQIHPLSISSDFTMFFLILSFIFRDFQKKVFLRQKQSQKQRF